MKIIILAAGKGERLMPLTRNTPKPLLHLGSGLTLLETQLKSIKESEVIDEVVLVVGYLADQIEAKIKLYRKNGLKIKTVYNPLYNVSNNLISLWLAKHEMDSNFMITNGDNVFKKEIFKELAEKTSAGITLTTTKIEEFNPDDMKVRISNNKIVEVSKKIKESDASGESPGLVKIAGEEYINAFVEAMEELVRDEENTNKFWLDVFNRLAKKGVQINSFPIDRNKWKEVDFHMDVDVAKKLVGLSVD